MSSDKELVARLRANEANDWQDLIDAADLIERLSAEVASLKSSLNLRNGLANVIGGSVADVNELSAAAKIAATKHIPLLQEQRSRAEAAEAEVEHVRQLAISALRGEE